MTANPPTTQNKQHLISLHTLTHTHHSAHTAYIRDICISMTIFLNKVTYITVAAMARIISDGAVAVIRF